MSSKRAANTTSQELASYTDSIQPKKKRSHAPSKTNPNPVGPDKLSECFKTVKTSMYVSLAPSYLNAPIQGIKAQHLDPLLMKYSNDLRSVVLGYTSVSIQNDNQETKEDDGEEREKIVLAQVNAHSPFSFLWINVTFIVWRPVVGDVVEGLIYMQSPSHIGLLIHDTFNGSIKKFNIPDDWKFAPNQEDENNDDEEGQEVSRGRNNILGQWVDVNDVPIDGKLRMTVKAVHTGGRVVSLEGTLIRPEDERSSMPVVPGGKKIKFTDDEMVVEKVDDEANVVVPKYEDESDGDVVAQEDSSEDEEGDSDSD